MEYRRLYIAYGSNINLEQMANRCPNSKIVSKEMLKGYELEFRGNALSDVIQIMHCLCKMFN